MCFILLTSYVSLLINLSYKVIESFIHNVLFYTVSVFSPNKQFFSEEGLKESRLVDLIVKGIEITTNLDLISIWYYLILSEFFLNKHNLIIFFVIIVITVIIVILCWIALGFIPW